jgi:hypothetical protein
MIEWVFKKGDRLTPEKYQEYLKSLKISTEYFRGDCPSCKEVFKIKPLPFEKVDFSSKYPILNCPYCGHQDYYHHFFSNDLPLLTLDTERVCRCGLTYSVTGVTVICPHCVIFNSRQLFMEQIGKINDSIDNV